MTGMPDAALMYDAESRTVAYDGASTDAYGFDGHDLRVLKTVSGATTVSLYSGTKAIAEYNAGAPATSPSKEYTYLGNSLLASYDGNVQYYLADHLSTRAITDGTGAVISELGTYPFGEEWYATSGATKWEFTNYQRDSESGMDYALARSFDPAEGRFSSPDPLNGTTAAPQSWNRYAYSTNDPINRFDPLGLMTAQTCTTEYFPGPNGTLVEHQTCSGGGGAAVVDIGSYVTRGTLCM